MKTTSDSSSQLLQLDQIQTLLNSDASLDILLKRLKKSINTGDEFSRYIKKKAILENEHFQQLNKISISTRTVLKSSTKLKNDSFSEKLCEIIEYDEKLYNLSSSYVKALNIMYDELVSLISTVSKFRKIIKEEGKKKEKECIESIISAEKSKQKYYHLCEDMEKHKISDSNKKSFSLKNKNLMQVMDDLQRKIDISNQDYKQKVSNCKKLKEGISVIHRPTNSKKLKNLILEIDIAMNVQLQKYVIWTETLVMNNGVLINPLNSEKISMKSLANSIDNEKDLYNYLIKFDNLNVNKLLIPVEYVEHHSTLKTNKLLKPFLNNSNINEAINNSKNSTLLNSGSVHNISSNLTSNVKESNYSVESNSSSAQHSNYSLQINNASLIDSKNQTLKSDANSLNNLSNVSYITRPTFGVPINDVIQFAGVNNVPLIVTRCIEIIEKYGLDIEGIYRTSGNKTTIQNLKEMVDQNFANYLQIGNKIYPNNVNDADIYCVASLLKLYFSSLPEPLLTKKYYQSFINTVKMEDDEYIAKRFHQLVFELPDSAYFTLRVLIFHLTKISDNQTVNRMTTKSLSIIWGPVLLNSESISPQDLSYKTMVVEELILIASEIFDPAE